jgi:hypothetical protein
MHFYAPPEEASGAHFDRFEEGVEKAYEYLKDPRHSDFALSVGPVARNAHSQTLMLEQIPDAGVLVQLFVPERMSPEGEDGWYTLVESRDHDRVSIKDVSTIYEEPDRKDVVQTRLSEGVLFSPRMYVSPALAKDALAFYLESRDLDDTLRKKPWKFLGLI